EYVLQNMLVVFGHDEIVSHACAQGNLQLNQFAPIVVHFTLKSMRLLTSSCHALAKYVKLLDVDKERCQQNLERSSSNLTPLINYFGHEVVSEAIRQANYDVEKALQLLAEKENTTVSELLKKLNIQKMTGLGYY
ncbi:MAG: aspartate ammonia-lyase, partial [Fervidobacterium pennivorans]